MALCISPLCQSSLSSGRGRRRRNQPLILLLLLLSVLQSSRLSVCVFGVCVCFEGSLALSLFLPLSLSHTLSVTTGCIRPLPQDALTDSGQYEEVRPSVRPPPPPQQLLLRFSWPSLSSVSLCPPPLLFPSLPLRCQAPIRGLKRSNL